MTTSAPSGRTPNGIWGGKLMWNQTPLLLQRAAGLPDRSGDGLLAAIRDVIGSDPVLVHVYRPDVVSQAVSFWRAVQTRVWRGRPDPTRDSRAEYHAGAIAHVVTMLREQEKGWRAWFDEEGIEPIEVSYPVLWRNLTQSSPLCSKRSGRIRGWLRPRCWNARPINAPTSGWIATVRRPRGRDSADLSDHEHSTEREERLTVGPRRVGLVQHRDQLLPKLLPFLVGEPTLHRPQRGAGDPVQHRVFAGQFVDVSGLPCVDGASGVGE